MQEAPFNLSSILNILPIAFLVGIVFLLVVAIQFFVTLGRDVKAIREMLERRKP